MNPDEVLVVYCTCPSEATAEMLANAIVKANAAACVNVLPGILSVYQWQGAVCREREFLLMIKTTAAAYQDLELLILRQHPYDVPEILAVRVAAGSSDYLQWVQENAVPLGIEK